jgi:kinetochore protein Mis13/DSN1
MAKNRPTTRRRSVKTAFEEDDAPVAKRPKTEVNGVNKRASGATKKTAKTAGEFGSSCGFGGVLGARCVHAQTACWYRDLFLGREADYMVAYDENDDGFQFTRRTSRRTTKAQPPSEPIPEEPPKPAPARRKKQSIVASEPAQEAPQKRRRSARLSGDGHELLQVDGPPDAAKPAPKRTKKTAPAEKEKAKRITPAPEEQKQEKSAFVGAQTPQQNGLHVAKKRDGATKIMLPFADTPVITRNKEMRKASKDGHRRSSTGLRGRRASSLIDSGMSNGEYERWVLLQ